MEFIVEVREVHVQKVRVTATTAQEAIDKVAEGEGELVEGSLEYSHTLDKATFTAEPTHVA